MEIGKESRVSDQSSRPPCDVDAHRWPAGALEDEIRAVDTNDLWCGVTALAHIAHDRRLTCRNVALALTTQDGTRIERVHVRVTTGRERF